MTVHSRRCSNGGFLESLPLIRNLIGTPEVLDSPYPWTKEQAPSHCEIIDCLEIRQSETDTRCAPKDLLIDILLIF
jgi:hypothetical protein